MPEENLGDPIPRDEPFVVPASPKETFDSVWLRNINISVPATAQSGSTEGNIHIEYIYIFSVNRWHVSTQKSTKVKDGYDGGTLFYHTNFEPVIMNKEYIKYKGKHDKHAEVKMVAQIGKALSGAGFAGNDIMVQGGSVKKAN